MKRTNVYFDGHNFYHGTVKGTKWKWLDPVRLVKSLIRDDNEIVSLKYFTAPIKTYPHDAAALDRQKIGPVNIVRKDFGKTVIVLNPHDRISWLRDCASYYKDIPRDILAQCQLPDTIPYKRTFTITKPQAWR